MEGEALTSLEGIQLHWQLIDAVPVEIAGLDYHLHLLKHRQGCHPCGIITQVGHRGVGQRWLATVARSKCPAEHTHRYGRACASV